MKGLSLEEINELFGDPVAVHITHNDKNENEDLEKRLEGYNVHGKHKAIRSHVEDVLVDGDKGSVATS
jgi:hypothetical protein